MQTKKTNNYLFNFLELTWTENKKGISMSVRFLACFFLVCLFLKSPLVIGGLYPYKRMSGKMPNLRSSEYGSVKHFLMIRLLFPTSFSLFNMF